MQGHKVVIDGVAFMRLHHHDGRFVRGGGLFALARRDPDGGHTLFCLELAADISRAAGPAHEAWSHAVSCGMNALLVHLAGSQHVIDEVDADAVFAPVRYDFPPGRDGDRDVDAEHAA